ncbi:hypothetical protein [Alkaliflexus imshenetskii]|uniref:hypothetical protein n=1 Tax=Alkaliflexus imshenetskii TaxID=286730 RepID=UPI0004793D07|nr:hypothetical protein [Alkaliflexus imshenetskii]
MRKMSFKLLIALAGVMMLAFSACKDDKDDPKEDPTSSVPVINVDFSFVVTGNSVSFATTRTGNVWFRNEDAATNYNVVDGQVVVQLPLKGTYQFTCNVLAAGITLTSEPFDVVIENDDLAFLDEGMWLFLSGGANKTKTWRMDIDENGKSLYFDGPIYYSGDDIDPYWAWDVLESQLPYDLQGKSMATFFNWSPVYKENTWLMPAENYGTITFNATAGTISIVRNGETCNNNFSFNPETMKLNISDCIIPVDNMRIDEGQFPDMSELRIFSLTEHSMQIGVKRVYEGENEDGSKKESKWVVVYNFIVEGHEYVKEEFAYTEPVKTSFKSEDLVGTWKFDPVMQDWIGWHAVGDMGTIKEASRLNAWTNTADMATTLAGWGAADAADTFAAASSKEFVFNADGSCVLAGKSNTFTVENGVITFGDDLTDEFALVWISLEGKIVKVLDVKKDADGNDYSTSGIWIGQQNDGKNESYAVHLIKK